MHARHAKHRFLMTLHEFSMLISRILQGYCMLAYNMNSAWSQCFKILQKQHEDYKVLPYHCMTTNYYGKWQ